MTRKAILLAGLAALMPGAVGTTPARAASSAAQPRFDPPSEAVLTRTVWRYLSDGQQIVVTRRYAVRFEAAAEGYRLDGALIEATVDAPQDLAPFAELERTRADTTMFPIVLDGGGRILTDGSLPGPEARNRAADLALRTIGSAKLSQDVKTLAARQVPVLTANSSVTPVPPDLFQPHPGQRREVRKLALPGGMEGEVEVAMKVDTAGSGRLPRQVERVVTTRLAGTTKVSREVWSFTSQ